jgi:hypothetical protein
VNKRVFVVTVPEDDVETILKAVSDTATLALMADPL